MTQKAKKTLYLSGAVFILAVFVLVGLIFVYFGGKSSEGVFVASTGAPVEILIPGGTWSFKPGEIVLKKGATYAIRVKNEDQFAHGIAIRELDVNEHIPGGQTITFNLTPKTSGTFIIYCSVVCGEGHTHMRGKITVIE